MGLQGGAADGSGERLPRLVAVLRIRVEVQSKSLVLARSLKERQGREGRIGSQGWRREKDLRSCGVARTDHLDDIAKGQTRICFQQNYLFIAFLEMATQSAFHIRRGNFILIDRQ